MSELTSPRDGATRELLVAILFGVAAVAFAAAFVLSLASGQDTLEVIAWGLGALAFTFLCLSRLLGYRQRASRPDPRS